MNKNIVVVGCGFVGLSNALLLSLKNKVIAVDNNNDKINKLKDKNIYFKDTLIKTFIKRNDLNIKFKNNFTKNHKQSDYIVIATPTDYNPKNNTFNTESIDEIIKILNDLKYKGAIVIKSTIPIGFTKKISKKYKDLIIFFSPEFLRETTALEDNMNPDRIILGGDLKKYKSIIAEFGLLLKESATNNPKIIITNSDEAESIKLFSNTFLAMRVAFFNELDTFAIKNNLNSDNIIKGVCKDKRIGDFYNNPSFGYGGYCLPKDTKQLLNNYDNIPNKLMKAIVDSNETRKNFIVSDIKNKITIDKTIGVYRLIMKKNSDNFRSSSILDVIMKLKKEGYKIKIYEPEINEKIFLNCDINNDLKLFKKESQLIICNRFNSDLDDVAHKIYTRDQFNIDL
jgi:UDPglucose 6-dehydrogenase